MSSNTFSTWIIQLYVSVDAATKDSLKAIDRPLFSDFWERFLVSTLVLLDGVFEFISHIAVMNYNCVRYYFGRRNSEIFIHLLSRKINASFKIIQQLTFKITQQ